MTDTPLDAVHEREDIVLATLPRLSGIDDVEEGSCGSGRRADVHVVANNVEGRSRDPRSFSDRIFASREAAVERLEKRDLYTTPRPKSSSDPKRG